MHPDTTQKQAAQEAAHSLQRQGFVVAGGPVACGDMMLIHTQRDGVGYVFAVARLDSVTPAVREALGLGVEPERASWPQPYHRQARQKLH